jgi:hypothetical protein
MDKKQAYLEKFFNALDLDAVIVRRKNDNLVYVVKNVVFEHRRRYLQHWFVVVEERDRYMVLLERQLLGIDQTTH